MVAFPLLETYLAQKAPGAEAITYIANGMPRGNVDLTKPKNSLTVQNAKGQAVAVGVDGIQLITEVSPMPAGLGPKTPLAFSHCTFRQIYDDAVAHGFAKDKPFQLNIVKTGQGMIGRLTAVGPAGTVMLDLASCRVKSE